MRNRLFPLLTLLLLATFCVSIVLTPGSDFSYAENRPLTRVPKPSLASWKDTSFQSTLESALSDQWPLSETLKTLHGQLGRFGLGYVGGLLGMLIPPAQAGTQADSPADAQASAQTDTHANAQAITQTDTSEVPPISPIPHISPLGGNVFEALIDGGRFPALWPKANRSPEDAALVGAESADLRLSEISAPLVVADPDPAKSLEALVRTADCLRTVQAETPQADFFTYYIETSIDIDFPGGAVTHPYSGPFLGALGNATGITSVSGASQSTVAEPGASQSTAAEPAASGYQTDLLSIHNMANLENWFYRTDHHWNATGQRAGYEAIVRLLKGEDEQLVPTEIITLQDVRFAGSRARSANDFTRSDAFDLLTFSLPDHQIWLDNAPGFYGNRDLYLSGQAPTDIGFNHYGHCNGQDYAEIHIAYPDNTGKGRLLVLADSYSNPLHELLAAHYEEAFFVDVRHYAATTDGRFDLPAYVAEHTISQVLVMGSFSFFKLLPDHLGGTENTPGNASAAMISAMHATTETGGP